MNLFLRKKRPGVDLKIVPRGNADIYPDDYNHHEGIRQIFLTGIVRRFLYIKRDRHRKESIKMNSKLHIAE
jgi:hypothetical protein